MRHRHLLIPLTLSLSLASAGAQAQTLDDEGSFQLKFDVKERVVGPGIKYIPRKGLLVESSDHTFSLATRVRAQLRYALHDDGQALTQAVMIRRARLSLAGHFLSPKTKFKLELLLSPRDLAASEDGALHRSVIHDVFVELNQVRDLNLRFGQFKMPFSRARLISGFDTQLVDRPITDKEFTLDRDIGLQLSSKKLFGLRWLRYAAAISSGEGHSSFAQSDLGLMYSTRVELLPFGPFHNKIPGDFSSSSGLRVALGAGYAFLDHAPRSRGLLGTELAPSVISRTHNATVDAMVKLAGFSLQADAYLRYGTLRDDSGATPPLPRNGYGGTLQGGYLLPLDFVDVELVMQGAMVRPYQQRTALQPRYALGTGVNLYLAQHGLKLQADFFRTWDEDGLAAGSNALRVQAAFAL